MIAAGHPVIQSGHSFGAERDGAFAYYDTAEALGFVIEAVEPPGADCLTRPFGCDAAGRRQRSRAINHP
jgi:hypothetical protein